MTFKTIAAAALLAFAPVLVCAETHEVKMLDRGKAGDMVFEPRFVSAAVGDTVIFLPTDKGHSAETMKGMVPEGQEPFVGKLNQEIAVEVTTPGMIGVECKPHRGMGMVMVIQVDDAPVPDGFLEVRMPRKARKAFEEILAENGF